MVDKIIEKKHHYRNQHGNDCRFDNEFFRQYFICGNQKRNVTDYEQQRAVIYPHRNRCFLSAVHDILHHCDDAADSARRKFARVDKIMEAYRIKKCCHKNKKY